MSKEGTALFLVSFILYLLELVFLFVIKLVLKKEENIGLSQQYEKLMSQVGLKHVALYTSIYCILLMISRIVTMMFTIVITLQLVSLSFDVRMLRAIRKTTNR